MNKNLSREQQIALIYDRWQKMTITSDPMFGLVMQNKKICLELINRALPNLKAKEIVQLETQKDVNSVNSHRVRFDVYVRDSQNNIVVIEMQVNNQKNLPARLRYYQEQIDHGLLHPGEDYSILNQYPTYIIMFCNFDYFGRGWARYEFELTCTKDQHLKFNDKRTVIVLNALANEFDKDDQAIKSFLALMRNKSNNNSRFIAQIQNEIKQIKDDPERRNGFMKYEINLMDAKREGREEGQRAAKSDGIKTLISTLQELNIEPVVIKQKVSEKYHLTEQEVEKFFK
ncbi:Rpn family recombination-promoting nuclease/putative transposase [Limosilactobacillus sp. RRLNB_1_1]|uniref:Rpn family recombination-promoting nuclease/putative transposase n=1 Tax=Limosilactobacillus albertensis TaxID=2759752 RepID=A0A7W3TQH0_9LACO|nr:Rpn family recombination-promoting nuclease/putative transposase [Limosilactobacillus albertensis]MBB1068883.1 Rpn family recombination-promoting nuclease/putative transposase [Limosilactobacillus albertensis]MCD7118642.1 Rpn family recombination-promoting nuclease/putative transposase [Limosilactobacillus albertensis]MCD7128209.1 Rpn family recombination-promoting nuclease/putative transposase [Limosilactobacillus albertensis]